MNSHLSYKQIDALPSLVYLYFLQRVKTEQHLVHLLSVKYHAVTCNYKVTYKTGVLTVNSFCTVCQQ